MFLSRISKLLLLLLLLDIRNSIHIRQEKTIVIAQSYTQGMSVSLCVCLFLTPLKLRALITKILRDDFPWGANGFRLKNVRIQPNVCQKNGKTLTILATR